MPLVNRPEDEEPPVTERAGSLLDRLLSAVGDVDVPVGKIPGANAIAYGLSDSRKPFVPLPDSVKARDIGRGLAGSLNELAPDKVVDRFNQATSGGYNRDEEGVPTEYMGDFARVGAMFPAAGVSNAPQGSLASGFTTKVLERLPKKPTIKESTLASELNRQDVTQAERNLFDRARSSNPAMEKDGQVDLDMLRQGVESGVVPLTPTKTSSYADVGLDAIGYSDSPFVKGVETKVYEGPVTHGIDNHFKNNKYFAHVRKFDERPTQTYNEYGEPDDPEYFPPTRYISEIQSDLFQKDISQLSGRGSEWSDALERMGLQIMETDPSEGLSESFRSKLADLTGQEIPPSINSAQARELIINTLDNPPPQNYKTQAANAVADYKKNWYHRIIREEVKQASKDGIEIMRFPTGDTAAKIEGWPAPEGAVVNVEQQINFWNAVSDKYGPEFSGWEAVKSLQDSGELDDKSVGELFKSMGLRNERGGFNIDKIDVPLYEILKSLDSVKGKKVHPFEGTPYKGLYDGYEKDIPKFLSKEYGNVQKITDENGNTWYEIRVDPEAKNKPVMAHAKAGVPIPPPQEEEEEDPKDKQMKELLKNQ